MNFPSNLKYTKEHEWIRVEGDTGWVGITDYAQGELGDVVFIELPAVGAKLLQGKTFGTIEAVKAVSDLYAPVTGEVVELNKDVQATPELVNKEPYDKGWMVKVKITNASELANLMDVESYKKLIAK
ncbi:MAG: glycine cleavage system protein GcvH [Ignavibacteriales bacterium]|nr:glycine cleavage system protein GcvH [Ignavibacteriales bacterium]MBI3788240.1 glycine cleavage system protein GcvH [Ignavibacteriales bacterium]